MESNLLMGSMECEIKGEVGSCCVPFASRTDAAARSQKLALDLRCGFDETFQWKIVTLGLQLEPFKHFPQSLL